MLPEIEGPVENIHPEGKPQEILFTRKMHVDTEHNKVPPLSRTLIAQTPPKEGDTFPASRVVLKTVFLHQRTTPEDAWTDALEPPTSAPPVPRSAQTSGPDPRGEKLFNFIEFLEL